jgi:hypothetical protein
MVPVITAIVAALLAGAVALYRERRLELQRFLVAARVVTALFGDARRTMRVFGAPDQDDGCDSRTVDAVTALLEVGKVWSEHRDFSRMGRADLNGTWSPTPYAAT